MTDVMLDLQDSAMPNTSASLKKALLCICFQTADHSNKSKLPCGVCSKNVSSSWSRRVHASWSSKVPIVTT